MTSLCLVNPVFRRFPPRSTDIKKGRRSADTNGFRPFSRPSGVPAGLPGCGRILGPGTPRNRRFQTSFVTSMCLVAALMHSESRGGASPGFLICQTRYGNLYYTIIYPSLPRSHSSSRLPGFQLFENVEFLNMSARPVSCLSLVTSSASMPRCFAIHVSDRPIL